MDFLPDDEQARVLEHERGAMLVAGEPGTGKSAALRERFARLIEAGADSERVALVVRTRRAKAEARAHLFDRLRASLPGMTVFTVYGLAHHVLTRRFGALDYGSPPGVLTAADQFSKVRDLLGAEDPSVWPAYGSMLGLRGFADEVRQFLLRAQEALIEPEEVERTAADSRLSGWNELAAFYRTYLDVLGSEEVVDFAGLVAQAGAAAAGDGDPLFDHVLVDDYQDATFAAERLVVSLGARAGSLVVAGNAGSHVFSFQGTTVRPLERFPESLAAVATVRLATLHRSPGLATEAWFAPHTSEEHAAVARELRRVHLEERVPWQELAVVVRREGAHVGGLLRALDDAGVPRSVPESGLSLLAEPATSPFVLALRWIARPERRDGLVESLLTSDLARLSPAAARGLVRAAASAGRPGAGALEHTEGLAPQEIAGLDQLRRALEEAEAKAASVLDAFRVLWSTLPYGRRLVEAGSGPAPDRRAERDLDAVVAFADAVSAAGERADPSVASFLEFVESGDEGPGLVRAPAGDDEGAVQVLTAHGAAGREFDTVLVGGTVEGNFPSLSRSEPMFDLAVLDRPVSQSERNRLRLEDERRLIDVVRTRARRRVVFTASGPQGETTQLSARSRFVAELGLPWNPAPAGPFDDPLTVAEAAAVWRRRLADPARPAGDRLAALEGLLALRPWVEPSAWWFQRDWTGTDRPLHESIRVSFSKLDTLENCELQYVLAQELGLETRAGYHAWVGGLVHELAEEFDRDELPRTLEALVAAADERWRPGEFPSFAVSEAFRRLVTKNILPGWFHEFGQSKPLDREVEFAFEFEGATVRGYIDRIGKAGSGTQITDYKTGKSRGKGKAEENLQLGIYYLAVNTAPELQEHRPVKAVELAFLRDRDWRTGHIARATLGFTSKEEPEYRRRMTERLAGLIGQLGELIRTERYRPNPSADCHFCQFKPLCPLFPEGAELFPVVAP